MYYPVVLPGRRVDQVKQVLALQDVAELVAEEDGQSLHRHEEISPGGQPAIATLVDPATRHHVVHVRVILQRPAPSMQNTEEAEAIGAHKSRVRGQGRSAWLEASNRAAYITCDGFGPAARSSAGSVKVTRK